MALRLVYGWRKDLVRRQHQFLGQANDPNPPLDLEDVAPAGVDHLGAWTSTGTSTTAFVGTIRIPATWTSTGTSTSSFAGDLVGAAPPAPRIGRPIRGPRVARTSPRRR